MYVCIQQQAGCSNSTHPGMLSFSFLFKKTIFLFIHLFSLLWDFPCYTCVWTEFVDPTWVQFDLQEEIWNVCWVVAASVHSQVTLCGWQDVKIQLLTRCSFKSGLRTSFVSVHGHRSVLRHVFFKTVAGCSSVVCIWLLTVWVWSDFDSIRLL